MSYLHREVQDLYIEANKCLDRAWSNSIDDELHEENAKLQALKTAVDRLVQANIEKMDIARGR